MDLDTARRALAQTNPDTNDWIRVDADGVPDSKGAFSARPVIPFKYLGTTTYPNEFPVALRAVHAETNERLFNQTMRLASQDRNGRHLLRFANVMGIEYEFDALATAKQDAAAVLDWNESAPKDSDRHDKPTLWMNPYGEGTNHASPVYRCGTMVHEAEHTEQIAKGFYILGRHTLASAIRCVRAQEAAARTAGTLALMRFMVDQPGDPTDRWKPNGYEKAFEDDHVSLQNAVKDALPDLQKGDVKAAARKIFLSFYDDQDALTYYDRQTIGFFRDRYLKDKGDKPYLPIFMTKPKFDHGEIVRTLTIESQPYLDDLGVCLNDPRYAGITQGDKVQTALKALNADLSGLRANGLSPDTTIAAMPLTEKTTPSRWDMHNRATAGGVRWANPAAIANNRAHQPAVS